MITTPDAPSEPIAFPAVFPLPPPAPPLPVFASGLVGPESEDPPFPAFVPPGASLALLNEPPAPPEP